jgi:prepilin-type N-terminal cleavage/methylation domain-containing protein
MRRRAHRDQSGFTLIEVITASLMILILAGLSYPPIRNYWWRNALEGAADQMVTEMRGLQSRVTAESHPLVYGIRFTSADGMMSDGRWGLVKYDPTGGAGGTPSCNQYATGTFEPGLFGAQVSITSPSFTGGTPSDEQAFCRDAITGADTDEFLFFYARGTATAGTVKIREVHLGAAKDITLTVSSLTGRVDRS